MSNTNRLASANKDSTIGQCELLIEFILAFNRELIESLSDTKSDEQQAKDILAWRHDCRVALEAAGEQIGLILKRRKSGVTN